MERSDYQGTPSTAAIAGHPVHPMFVMFPIALWMGVLATDPAFWGTDDAFRAQTSEWLLVVGAIMSALAAVAQLVDFAVVKRVRSLAAGWVHRIGGGPGAAVVPFGSILSAIVVFVFLVTGWLGGELVFRHRIGILNDQNCGK